MVAGEQLVYRMDFVVENGLGATFETNVQISRQRPPPKPERAVTPFRDKFAGGEWVVLLVLFSVLGMGDSRGWARLLGLWRRYSFHWGGTSRLSIVRRQRALRRLG